jgi:hypothetical protein
LGLVLSLAALADAPDPGGFVTRSQGAISYQAVGVAEQPLQAFAKLAVGTRVKLPEGAKLQIVYLRGARQESWTGKAAIEVGETESKVVGPAVVPEVKTLQPFMVETLVKSPAVMGNIHARQGMIRVRSLQAAARIREAEDRYAELRGQAAEDDITPEIYLLTALHGLKAYQGMKRPLAEMLRRQPDNAEAKALHEHFLLLLNTGSVEAPAASKAPD